MCEPQPGHAHGKDFVHTVRARQLHLQHAAGEQANALFRLERALDADKHLPTRLQPLGFERDLHAQTGADEKPLFVRKLVALVQERVDVLLDLVETAAEIIVIVAGQVRRPARGFVENAKLADKAA